MRVLCRDAEWLVTKIDFSDNARQHQAVHCVGADELVRGHEAIFLTQLDTIEPVDPRRTRLIADPSSGYRLSRLFLEAQLRQMPATGVEPDLKNMGVFKPMRFQVQTVEWSLKQLRPRLLLADAVGLGKTIQVGMVLSELARRGRAHRLLVLTKKSMLTQFQSELWNRFGIPLVRLDSTGIARLRLRIPANKNPFEVYHRIIISIDTLKNIGSYRHFLEKTRWDCVVIDEAHNVAAAGDPQRHLSYRLARLLSRKADSMILTTATPHNGRKETFGRLISLLDPAAIPDPEFREYTADDVKGFFLMRFKQDIRGDAGDELTDRQLVPLEQTTIDATPAEEKVYAALAELREQVLKRAREQSSRNFSLLQYGIYKQFLSSPESCRQTLRKRLDTLAAEEAEGPEREYLQHIHSLLAELTIRQSSRYRLLKRQLDAIGWDGSPASPRLLVFTEYRETQEALARTLSRDYNLDWSPDFDDQPGQVLAIIHGSCPDTSLMKTVEAFGTGSAPLRMLLATDVASEGINLHYECHHILHYDLPWSIITLVQRNGRIDRIGQKRSPVLRYLRVRTAAGMLRGDETIFARLVEKVEEINRSTRSGESVLKLYDPEAEERYLAGAGLLAGNVNVLEKPAAGASAEAIEVETLLNQANPAEQESFLKFLLGETAEPRSVAASSTEQTTAAPSAPTRLRLYDDKSFLTEGYRYLAETDGDYLALERAGNLTLLTAPADLRRRLGAPDERGDVIFGATAIPAEAWPENNQFRLTDEVDQVELAIKAARNTSGYWSKELLATDQHPILQWLTERLLMQLGRGECPHVTSRRLPAGEICYCFIGQVASRGGTPLVVDAHAIAFRKGGQMVHRPLADALAAAGFANLVNDGEQGNIEAAKTIIPAAVEESLKHMQSLAQATLEQYRAPLEYQQRRLDEWEAKRRELLESRIAALGPEHSRSRAYRRDLEEMAEYLRDRRDNWLIPNYGAVSQPHTQLVLVIQGI